MSDKKGTDGSIDRSIDRSIVPPSGGVVVYTDIGLDILGLDHSCFFSFVSNQLSLPFFLSLFLSVCVYIPAGSRSESTVPRLGKPPPRIQK